MPMQQILETEKAIYLGTTTKHLSIQTIPTPLGEIVIATTNDALYLLAFQDQKNISQLLTKLQITLRATASHKGNKIAQLTRIQLEEYFAGKRQEFTIPIRTSGTPFQQNVWETLHTIPYGVTCSYLEIAQSINNPKGVRGVAQANAKNPIAIIIPCHRVIGSKGALTGYNAGLERKQWLLKLESNNL